MSQNQIDCVLYANTNLPAWCNQLSWAVSAIGSKVQQVTYLHRQRGPPRRHLLWSD